jgi:ABC-type polysaccharide/polyol phosphate export permease
MQALMRILFYMSPILWIPKNHGVSGIVHHIMLFNPVYFIAESYRAAILFHQSLTKIPNVDVNNATDAVNKKANGT